jgi:hypothetical protein
MLAFDCDVPAVRLLLLVLAEDRVVIARLEASVVGCEEVFFDEGESSDAKKDPDRIVKDVGGEVPDTGIALDVAGELDRNGNVDNVRQHLGYTLFRGVHEPDLPGSFGFLNVPFVDQHAEGKGS